MRGPRTQRSIAYLAIKIYSPERERAAELFCVGGGEKRKRKKGHFCANSATNQVVKSVFPNLLFDQLDHADDPGD